MLRRMLPWLALIALVLLPVAGPAAAQEPGARFNVHSFGAWSYARTDGHNLYLSGSPQGDYRYAALGLNVSADVDEHLRIEGQTGFRGDGAEQGQVELDYAFVDWKFSDYVHARAGQVKQPFGLYADFYSVGTLRPMIQIPVAVYGPAGIVGQSYKGVGLTGRLPFAKTWALSYDLYGGGTDLEEEVVAEAFLLGEPLSSPIEIEHTRDCVGGRILLDTPVEGLQLGGSAYSGIEVGANRREGWAASAELVRSRILVRAEIGTEDVRADLHAQGTYVQAALRLDQHWQIAGEFDRFTSHLPPVPVPSAPSLLDHDEAIAGLNYWFNNSFVAKVNYSFIRGNRFANPGLLDLPAAVAGGTLEQRTRLLQFATQFSF